MQFHNNFNKHLCFNSALAFTFIGARIDDHITDTRGPNTSHIHGEMCHRIGSLFPQSTVEPPSFAQIYIFDTDNETQNRLNIMPSLNQATLAAFQNLFMIFNKQVGYFCRIC